MKDESLDIAGFSNEAEPVPLFAHECAGLYEDDEIPGAQDEEEENSSNRQFFNNDDKEDFDDPTLEKFPSTRDAIISTVRKVESGLNVDQVSIEDAPRSPVAHARSSPQSEARSESAVSPGQTSRDLQTLPVPLSLTTSNISATSLHSIAEDAEGAEEEEEETFEQELNDVGGAAEQSNGIDENHDNHEKSEAEVTEESKANEIAPIAEQAETAEEVIEAAQDVDGEQGKEIDSTRDLPAVDDIPVQSIDSIVELPAATEDISSPIELPPAVQDIASVVEQTNGHRDASEEEPVSKAAQDDIATGTEPVDSEANAGNGSIETVKEIDEEAAPAASKPTLEDLVTIPSPSVASNTNLLSPASDDDEAVIVKSIKGEESTKSGYLTPERAATPQPEEPGSPREPTPNTADPVAKLDLESDAPEAEPVATRSVPPSPQIVLSKPNETQPEKELLPAAALGGSSAQEAEPLATSEVAKNDGASRDIDNAEGPVEVTTSGSTEDDKATTHGSKDVESVAEPSTAGESEATSAPSQSKDTAVTSATEGSPTDGLKQRVIGRPDPADRSATSTPKSIPDSHKDAIKGGNWFSSFLRLIFIDFFGGLLRKLTGGDRRT